MLSSLAWFKDFQVIRVKMYCRYLEVYLILLKSQVKSALTVSIIIDYLYLTYEWSIIFLCLLTSSKSNSSKNRYFPSWSSVHFRLRESRIAHVQADSFPIYENWVGKAFSFHRWKLQELKVYNHKGTTFVCWIYSKAYFSISKSKDSTLNLRVHRNMKVCIWILCWHLGKEIFLFYLLSEKLPIRSIDKLKP